MCAVYLRYQVYLDHLRTVPMVSIAIFLHKTSTNSDASRVWSKITIKGGALRYRVYLNHLRTVPMVFIVIFLHKTSTNSDASWGWSKTTVKGGAWSALSIGSIGEKFGIRDGCFVYKKTLLLVM